MSKKGRRGLPTLRWTLVKERVRNVVVYSYVISRLPQQRPNIHLTMAESLLAILLVTTSANDASLVYRCPAFPVSPPRLSRVRPDDLFWPSQLDNLWRASNPNDTFGANAHSSVHDCASDPEYRWQRPNPLHERPPSFFASAQPGRSSPTRDRSYSIEKTISQQYDRLFGYSTQFLARTLCPQRSMCHQKFELVVDGLAFIGHPVCADADGEWRFKPEKLKAGPRGRDARGLDNFDARQAEDNGSISPVLAEPSPPKSSWLHTFHLVFVLDLPDPSSSASGNVSKYFDIIYEQIAFTATAVLFQEQVLSNFVETQCDTLSLLKESSISKGDPYEIFASKALELSSIASGMKSIYDAIRSKSIAYITFNNLPMELQLPPYLETLLHSEGDYDTEFIDQSDDDDIRTWGQDLSFGWRLPVLAPWKSLLLLDGDNEIDPNITLRGPQLTTEDRTLAEGLVRFLETASVTLSLADMASLLDWDLETQIYPVVRWLVQHRRAKIVDTVHAGLKTVFSLPTIFQPPLAVLTAEFEKQFTHPSIPPLPRILAAISTSMSRQTENHFFASVVKSKELIPMYHDVVLWMLKRDMLVTLHLRIRVVATVELRRRVRANRRSGGLSSRYSQGFGLQQDLQDLGEAEQSAGVQSGVPWLSLSPKSARKHLRRIPSNESGKSEMSELIIREDDEHDLGEDRAGAYELDPEEEFGSESSDDQIVPSIINDPGQATALQRRWLSAMSDGKEPYIAKRFEQINQYFDGKKSDDEILFLAGISRKQLRELLHHYEEYLQTFLHPS